MPAPPTPTLRATLTTLRPGAGIWFPRSGAQPFNRAFYLRVNGVAYALWGAGGYRMRTGVGAVGVVRLRKGGGV